MKEISRIITVGLRYIYIKVYKWPFFHVNCCPYGIFHGFLWTGQPQQTTWASLWVNRFNNLLHHWYLITSMCECECVCVCTKMLAVLIFALLTVRNSDHGITDLKIWLVRVGLIIINFMMSMFSFHIIRLLHKAMPLKRREQQRKKNN